MPEPRPVPSGDAPGRDAGRGRGTGATGDLRVTRGLSLPARELSWRFSRAGGPGGQGVNTTDSRVELRWSPSSSQSLSDPQRERLLGRLGSRLVDGELVVRASEHREQRRNRTSARERLAALVREGLAPPPRSRTATAPSRRARARRVDAKTARGRTKSLRRRPDDA